uniref:Uncharacterized protein n=1 Tax=Cacopsylla melanoneura TaxID=428564 RepID=A0A8D8ZYC1_9HEMI
MGKGEEEEEEEETTKAIANVEETKEHKVEEISVFYRDVEENSDQLKLMKENSNKPEEVEQNYDKHEEMVENSSKRDIEENKEQKMEENFDELEEMMDNSDKPKNLVENYFKKDLEKTKEQKVEENYDKAECVEKTKDEEKAEISEKLEEKDEYTVQSEKVEDTIEQNAEEISAELDELDKDNHCNPERVKIAAECGKVDENKDQTVEVTSAKSNNVVNNYTKSETKENEEQELDRSFAKSKKIENTYVTPQEVPKNIENSDAHEKIEQTSVTPEEVTENLAERVEVLEKDNVKEAFAKIQNVEENFKLEKAEETREQKIEETLGQKELEESCEKSETHTVHLEKVENPASARNKQQTPAFVTKTLHKKDKKLKGEENNVECVVKLINEIEESCTSLSEVKQYPKNNTPPKIKRKMGPKSKVRPQTIISGNNDIKHETGSLEIKDTIGIQSQVKSKIVENDDEEELVALSNLISDDQVKKIVKVKKLCPKSKKYVFSVTDTMISEQDKTELDVNLDDIKSDPSENENLDYSLSAGCLTNIEMTPLTDFTAGGNGKTEFHERTQEQNTSALNLELEIPKFSVRKDIVTSKADISSEKTPELDPNSGLEHNRKCGLKTKINIKNMSIVEIENQEADIKLEEITLCEKIDTSDQVEKYAVKDCYVNIDVIEMEGNSISGESLNKLVKKNKRLSYQVTARRKKNLKRHLELEGYIAQHVKQEVMSDDNDYDDDDDDVFTPNNRSVYSDDSKYFTVVRLRNKEITKYVNMTDSETSDSEDGYSLCSDGPEGPLSSESGDEIEDEKNKNLEYDNEDMKTVQVSLVDIDNLLSENSSIKLNKDTLEKLDCKITNLKQIIDNNIQVANKENDVVNPTKKLVNISRITVGTHLEFKEKKISVNKEIEEFRLKGSKPSLQNTHASSFETNGSIGPESKQINQSFRKTESQESPATNSRSRLLITPSENGKVLKMGNPPAKILVSNKVEKTSGSLPATTITLGKSVSVSVVSKSESAWEKYNNGSRSITELPETVNEHVTTNPQKLVKPNVTERLQLGTKLVNITPLNSNRTSGESIKRKVSITPLKSRLVVSSSTSCTNKPRPLTLLNDKPHPNPPSASNETRPLTLPSDKPHPHPPPASDNSKIMSLAEFISKTKEENIKGNFRLPSLKSSGPLKKTNSSALIAKDILKSCTKKNPSKPPQVSNRTFEPLPLIVSRKNLTITPVVKPETKIALKKKVVRAPKRKFVNATLTKATDIGPLPRTFPTANILKTKPPKAKFGGPPLKKVTVEYLESVEKTLIINESNSNALKGNIAAETVKLSDGTSSHSELSGILSEINQIETFSEGNKEFTDVSNDLMKDQATCEMGMQNKTPDMKQSPHNNAVKYTNKMTLNEYSFPNKLKPTSCVETLSSNLNLMNNATLQESFSYEEQDALEDLFPDSVLNSQLFRNNQSGNEFTLQEASSMNLQPTASLSNLVSGYSGFDNVSTPVQSNAIILTSCEENMTSRPTTVPPCHGDIYDETSIKHNQIIQSPQSNVTQALRSVRPVKMSHDKTVTGPGALEKDTHSNSADPHLSHSSQPPIRVSSSEFNSQQSTVISSISCALPSIPASLTCPSLDPLPLSESTSLGNMSSGNMPSCFPTYVNVVAPDGVSTPLVSMMSPNCSIQVSPTTPYSQPFIEIVSEATELLAPSIPSQDIMLTDPSYQQLVPAPSQQLLITSSPKQLSVSPNPSHVFTPNSAHQQMLSSHSNQNSFIPCTSNVQISIANNSTQVVPIPSQQISIPNHPTQQSIPTTDQHVPMTSNQQLLTSPCPKTQPQNYMGYNDPLFVPGHNHPCFDQSSPNTTGSISSGLGSKIPVALGSNIPSLDASCSGVNNTFDNYMVQTPNIVSPRKDSQFSNSALSDGLFQPMDSWQNTPLSENIDNTELDHSGGTPKRKRSVSNHKSPRKSKNRKSPCRCLECFDSIIDSVLSHTNDANSPPCSNMSDVQAQPTPYDMQAPPIVYNPPTPLPPIQSLNSHLPVFQVPSSSCSDNVFTSPNMSLNSTSNEGMGSYTSYASVSSENNSFSQISASNNSETERPDSLLDGNYVGAEFQNLTDWLLRNYFEKDPQEDNLLDSDSLVLNNTPATVSSVETISQLEASGEATSEHYFLLDLPSTSGQNSANQSSTDTSKQSLGNEIPQEVINPSSLDPTAGINRIYQILETKSKQNLPWNQCGLLGPTSFRSALDTSVSSGQHRRREPVNNQQGSTNITTVIPNKNANNQQNLQPKTFGIPTTHKKKIPPPILVSVKRKSLDDKSDQIEKQKNENQSNVNLIATNLVGESPRPNSTAIGYFENMNTNQNIIENVTSEIQCNQNSNSFTSDFTNKTPILLSTEHYETHTNKIVSGEGPTLSEPPLKVVPKPSVVTIDNLAPNMFASSISEKNTHQLSNVTGESQHKTQSEMAPDDSNIINKPQTPTSKIKYQHLPGSTLKPIYSKPHLTLNITSNLMATIPESTPPPFVKVGTKSFVKRLTEPGKIQEKSLMQPVKIQKNFSALGLIRGKSASNDKFQAKDAVGSVKGEDNLVAPDEILTNHEVPPIKVDANLETPLDKIHTNSETPLKSSEVLGKTLIQLAPLEKGLSKSTIALNKSQANPVFIPHKTLTKPEESLETTRSKQDKNQSKSKATDKDQEKSAPSNKDRRKSGVKNSGLPVKSKEKPGKTSSESSKRKLSKHDETTTDKHDMNSIIEQQLQTVKKFCSEKIIKSYLGPMKGSNYRPSSSSGKTETKANDKHKPFQNGDYCVKSQDLFKLCPSLWRVYPEKKSITEFVYGVAEEEDVGRYNLVFRQNATIGNFLSVDTNLWVKIYLYKDSSGTRFDQVKNEQAIERFITEKSFVTSERMRGTFEVYLQAIISQALNINFLSFIAAMKENNSTTSYFYRPWVNINDMVKKYAKIMNRCFLRYDETIVEALIQYPFCVVKQCDVPDIKICPLCDNITCKVKIVLRGPFYDRKSLASLDNDQDKKEFYLCEECAYLCVLFSKISHLNYLVFQLALNMVKAEFPSVSDECPLLNESVLSNKKFYDDLFLWFQTLVSYIDYCEYFILSGPYILRRRLKRKKDDFVCEVRFEEVAKDVGGSDETKNDSVEKLKAGSSNLNAGPVGKTREPQDDPDNTENGAQLGNNNTNVSQFDTVVTDGIVDKTLEQDGNKDTPVTVETTEVIIETTPSSERNVETVETTEENPNATELNENQNGCSSESIQPENKSKDQNDEISNIPQTDEPMNIKHDQQKLVTLESIDECKAAETNSKQRTEHKQEIIKVQTNDAGEIQKEMIEVKGNPTTRHRSLEQAGNILKTKPTKEVNAREKVKNETRGKRKSDSERSKSKSGDNLKKPKIELEDRKLSDASNPKSSDKDECKEPNSHLKDGSKNERSRRSKNKSKPNTGDKLKTKIENRVKSQIENKSKGKPVHKPAALKTENNDKGKVKEQPKSKSENVPNHTAEHEEKHKTLPDKHKHKSRDLRSRTGKINTKPEIQSKDDEKRSSVKSGHRNNGKKAKKEIERSKSKDSFDIIEDNDITNMITTHVVKKGDKQLRRRETVK